MQRRHLDRIGQDFGDRVLAHVPELERGVIEPGALDTVPEFVRNRVAMQASHLDAVGAEFPGLVRGVLPLHDDEIRGVAELRATAGELFGTPVPE